MTNEEAIGRIRDHMDHHGIGHYPHLKIKEALDLAISALQSVGKDITAPTQNDHFRDFTKMVPLTLKQLREMDGQPVWIVEAPYWGHWELSEDAEDYILDRDPDLYGLTYPDPDGKGGLHKLGWLAYAHPPAHIDREAWTAEWKNHYKSGASAGTGFVCSFCDMWNGRKSHICPSCGRAMDGDGLSELEKRLRR